jgi:hypothetical protein
MDVENKFHYNFQVGFKVHMLGYRGVNLKVTSIVHKEAKVKARVRMKSKEYVATRLKNLKQSNH